jgi:hypothetical protein
MEEAEKEKPAEASATDRDANSEVPPKYPHPKILLIDIPESAAEPLRERGYEVKRGSFGPLIAVQKKRGHVPLPLSGRLPNQSEQELIAVDTKLPRKESRTLPDPPHHEKWLWERAGAGVVDPRPWAMVNAREDFDRTYAHGGVFICFTAPRFSSDYQYVESENEANWENSSTHSKLTTWDFLSVLADVKVTSDSGEEITADPAAEEIPGLTKALEGASFTCTLDRTYDLDSERWVSLAKNKFEQTVAAVILPSKGSKEGVVFLLPRLKERDSFLRRLIEETVPRLAPKLFPHIKGGEWAKHPPYELPQVAELRAEIRVIEKEAKQKTSELREQIEARKNEFSFLSGLLTKDADQLVAAVKQTLELLGFQHVKDVDEEIEEGKPRREDLQIWDRDPVLIAEVKGIGGLPREADALQVTKYLAPRMKEWDRSAQGLTIINHQLKVEGLKRQHSNVFQDDVVTSAGAYGVGLLTTWDLFRLARSKLRYDWQPGQVVEVLYPSGLIEPIPTHYQFVGTVDRLYEEASAVIVDLTGEIKKGDTLSYELPIEFEEEAAASIHLNDAEVERAAPGEKVGIKTGLTKEQAKTGVRVFRVAMSTGG